MITLTPGTLRRYRRKPKTFEAVQYVRTNAHVIAYWIGNSEAAVDAAKEKPPRRLAWMSDDGRLCIAFVKRFPTAYQIVEEGDWVVKEGGEFAIVHDTHFKDFFEPEPDA